MVCHGEIFYDMVPHLANRTLLDIVYEINVTSHFQSKLGLNISMLHEDYWNVLSIIKVVN